MGFVSLNFWEVATLIGCVLWIYYMVKQVRKWDGKTWDNQDRG